MPEEVKARLFYEHRSQSEIALNLTQNGLPSFRAAHRRDVIEAVLREYVQ